MSQSPTTEVTDPNQAYLDAWQGLAVRIQQGQSFSGRERNCCFLNTHGERFADVSAAMGLDLADDSRAVALVDWDHDGDLDLWISNRTGPRVRYLENNLIEQPQSILIRLIGNPAKQCNRDAIGARVRIAYSTPDQRPTVLTRTLYAGDAFLSQSSKWLHFGMAPEAAIGNVEVRWPGSTDWIAVAGVKASGRYIIDQSSGVAALQSEVREVSLAAAITTETKSGLESTARVVLPQPKVVLPFRYSGLDGSQLQVAATTANRLIVLWAPWCAPCVSELAELSSNADRIKTANVEVFAIDVDTLSEEYETARAAAMNYQKSANLPFVIGLADEASLRRMTDTWQNAMYRNRQPPLPSSFLLDSQGRLRVVYSGRIGVDQLIRDAADLDIPDDKLPQAAIPFTGRSSVDEFATNPIAIASVYREELQFGDAEEYLSRYAANNPVPPGDDNSVEARKLRVRAADVFHHLGKIAMDQNQYDRALAYLDQSLTLNAKKMAVLIDRATCFQGKGELKGAIRSLDAALRINPRNSDGWNQLGIVMLTAKQMENAANCFERSLSIDPRAYSAANNLAWIRATAKSPHLRNGAQAIRVAKSLAAGPGANRSDVLDTLAAAYAENGDFQNAVLTAQQAIDLANKRGMHDLAQRIHARLALYRRSKPFRAN